MESIIIDMDEVMADTMRGMINWYRENGYDGAIDFGKMPGGSWIKGFPEQHQAMVRSHIFDPGFFRNLPVMKDCAEVIEQLNKKYRVFIVSAAMEFPHSLKDKLDWLNEHFTFLTWQQFVFCGSKSIVQGDHMIDDLVRNFTGFKGKPYLFSGPHNSEISGYDRLNSWKEVAAVFL
ncbi:MAG: 5 nucleotidase deoxy cytosolic type [Chitinophagaceae bacterium]|nr:5 nucleotidase deoxy cytosolic type [Chitinophagaceae bacterium]